jgi:hypothetical protein
MVGDSLVPFHLLILNVVAFHIEAESSLWVDLDDVIGGSVWSEDVGELFGTSFTAMIDHLKRAHVGQTIIWDKVVAVLSELEDINISADTVVSSEGPLVESSELSLVDEFHVISSISIIGVSSVASLLITPF